MWRGTYGRKRQGHAGKLNFRKMLSSILYLTFKIDGLLLWNNDAGTNEWWFVLQMDIPCALLSLL